MRIQDYIIIFFLRLQEQEENFMEFKEAVKQIEKSEKNVDKVLKAGRLERHERQPMSFERYKFTLYFIAGMVAMIMGFVAAYMIIYFWGT